MNENHKIESILAGIGSEPVPEEIHRLAESMVNEFRQELAAGLDSIPLEPQDAAIAAGQEASPSDGDTVISQDPTQPAVRLVPDVPTELADGVSRETHPIEPPPSRRHVPRRFIAMFQRKTIRWFAVAAAIVIAFVGVGSWKKLNNGKSGLAFGQVLKIVQSARSVQFKGVSTVQIPGVGPQTVTTDIIVVGEPNRMRQTTSMSGTTMPGGMVMIWDFGQGRCLTLDPQNKRASILEMSNVPPEQKSSNLLDQFRQLNEKAGTPIGEKEIGGRLTQGFKVTTPPMEMLIWADIQTQLPVQIETTMKLGMLPSTSMTMTDFVWDQEIDASLLSVTPPAGYESQTFKMNMGPATEQDLIDALKSLVQVNGDKFPASLDLMSVMRELGKNSKSLKKLKSSQDNPAKAKEFEAIMVQFATAVARAWMFINDPKNGDDFHYAGKDVAVDQAGTPVLWYQPKGSASYRVIDADLTVRDVLPADLPSVASTLLRPATSAPAAQPPQPPQQ